MVIYNTKKEISKREDGELLYVGNTKEEFKLENGNTILKMDTVKRYSNIR